MAAGGVKMLWTAAYLVCKPKLVGVHRHGAHTLHDNNTLYREGVAHDA